MNGKSIKKRKLEKQVTDTYTFKITNEKSRIDKFLSDQLADHSRSQIQEWIKDGDVRVNDSVVKANYKVQEGDEIEVTPPEPVEIDAVAEDIPLDIVYEDADVVVVNKPQGMVVHPSAGHASGTLVNALLYRSEEHTSELQSRGHLVCRLLLEKKKLM